MLMHFTNTTIDFIEPCECAFFSAFIDESLNIKPCSFANHNEYTYNLKEFKFLEIWDNYWNSFRDTQKNDCKRECKNTNNCRGGCPYYSQINLCKTVNPLESLV
jgi:radical SAM protein with 4Fe4S-binding SPASM domain